MHSHRVKTTSRTLTPVILNSTTSTTTQASSSAAALPLRHPDTVEAYRKILSERFGYAELRPAQARTLSALEDGDVFAVSPTGSGKSMSYVLPALLRGRVLVVSPHIALMQDQVEGLRANGVNASFINSTLSNAMKREVYLEFTRGETALLYTSPESLANDRFVKGLAKVGLNLLAIDEAHCVSEWGHTFRPDYLRLMDVREKLGLPRTLALTATAAPLARDDIVKRLGLDGAEQIVNSVSRENLVFTVEQAASNEQKREMLVQFVVARKKRSGIVYASSRDRTEELAELLTEQGLSAGYYHAGLDPAQRSATQRAFMTDEIDVIVATNAFGLGVDKPDIRFVVHFDMPGRLEAYYQEAGRAGRDGDVAECFLIYTAWSRRAPEFFIERDHPMDNEVRQVWVELLNRAESGEAPVGSDEGGGSDGFVMAVRALQESGLIAGDGMSLLSQDARALIRTDAIRRHRQYQLDMLDSMVEFAITEHCRLGVVLRYFGEVGGPACGRCDNCSAVKSGAVAANSAAGRRATGQGRQVNRRSAAPEPMGRDDVDRPLFEKLRAWRKQRADEDSVPAFVVFADRVLVELARKKPTDMGRLADVSGVGSVKRDRYGRELLRLILEHRKSG